MLSQNGLKWILRQTMKLSLLLGKPTNELNINNNRPTNVQRS